MQDLFLISLISTQLEIMSTSLITANIPQPLHIPFL